MSNDSKIVFITGANTGIGLEVVKALVRSEKQTYRIFLGCRSLQKGEEAAEAVKKEYPDSKSTVGVVQVDVEDDTSIEKAFEILKGKVERVDVLINNAGAAFDAQITPNGPLSVREAFQKSWNVNVSGASIVTETFLPLLLASPDPRLIFNTSGLSSLTAASTPGAVGPYSQPPPAGLPKARGPTAYASSKTGLNMLMLEYARILKNDGVKVWAVAPGFLATGLGGIGKENLKARGAQEPSAGGEAIRRVVEGERDEDAGRVVREYGETGVQDW